MDSTKSTWGGRREGAGRPPLLRDGKRRGCPITVKLADDEHEALRAEADRRGLTLSALVTIALHEARAFGRRSRPSISDHVAEGA